MLQKIKSNQFKVPLRPRQSFSRLFNTTLGCVLKTQLPELHSNGDSDEAPGDCATQRQQTAPLHSDQTSPRPARLLQGEGQDEWASPLGTGSAQMTGGEQEEVRIGHSKALRLNKSPNNTCCDEGLDRPDSKQEN